MRVPKTLVLPVTPRGSVVFPTLQSRHVRGKPGSPGSGEMEPDRGTSEKYLAIARVPSLARRAAIILSSKALEQKLELAHFRFHRERVFGLVDDLDREHPIIAMFL